MNDQSQHLHHTNPVLITAALVIIVFGIIQASSVLTLLLVSVFLAVLGTPPVLWLKQKRVPNALAVLIVLAAMIARAVDGRSIGGGLHQQLFCFATGVPVTSSGTNRGSQRTAGEQGHQDH